MKTPNVLPYRLEKGRQSFFLYHPKAHPDMTFEQARKIFDSNLASAITLADMYNEEMPNTQKIFSDEVKREIKLMLTDIDKSKDIYELEALSESLYAGPEETKYRYNKNLPYYKEIQARAAELRALDMGLVLAGSGSKIILSH